MSGFAENINYVAQLDHTYGTSVELAKTGLVSIDRLVVNINVFNKATKTTNVVTADVSNGFESIADKIAEAKRILELSGLVVVSTITPIGGYTGIKLKVTATVDMLVYDSTMTIESGSLVIPVINGKIINAVNILPIIATLDSNVVESIISVSDNIQDIQNAQENVLLIMSSLDKANAFANNDRNIEVEPGKYSSKHYSLESKESMVDAKKIAIGDGEQTLSDGTIEYSAKHYADESASIKLDVETIKDDIEDDLSDVIKIVMNPKDSQYTLSDGTTTGYSAKHYHENIIDLNAVGLSNVALTNADVVLTHADVALTHEDVRLTGLDVDSTGADVITTEAYMDLAEDYKNDALHLATNAKDAVVTLSNGGGTAYSARHYAEYAEVHRDTAAEMATDAIKAAIFPIDSQYTLNDNTVDYSSKHYHAKTVIAKNAADGSATAAATSAELANSSAQAALLSQSAAATSASNAATTLAQVNLIMDNFDDRYLGGKAEDPTLDNDGETLVIGAIYYNTQTNELRFYDGATWDRPEYSASQSAIASETSRVAAINAQELSEAAKDIAVTKASEASDSATAASTSAITANIKAIEASDSAMSAASSATIATEKAEAVSSLFLGAKASDPTTDNEGDVLQVGAIYYNTSTNSIRVWNDTIWEVAVFEAGNAVITFNGRDGAVTLNASDVNTAIGVDIAETFDSHSALIVDNTASILALAKSNATGSFGASDIINLSGTEQTMGFSVLQQSTNTDKFELATDTVTIKATGNYTFLSTVIFEDNGANGAVGTVTFRVRDAGNVYYTQTTTVEIDGYDRETIPFNSLLVVPSGVPLTAYITVTCNISGYRIVGFESVLTSEKAAGELSGLASHTAVTPSGNISSINVQDALEELDNEKLSMVIANASHIGRADKYLAAQAVANMVYTDGKLSKVQYNNATDVDYEVLTYGVDGKLYNVAHYVSSTLAGNTALSYAGGKLVSAIYIGV